MIVVFYGSGFSFAQYQYTEASILLSYFQSGSPSSPTNRI